MIIHLVDGALNLGRDAETILRFDDRPPGDVSRSDGGWISRDELPIQQGDQKAVPGGRPESVATRWRCPTTGRRNHGSKSASRRSPGRRLDHGDRFDRRPCRGDRWISAATVSGLHRVFGRAGQHDGSGRPPSHRNPRYPEFEQMGQPSGHPDRPDGSDQLSGIT